MIWLGGRKVMVLVTEMVLSSHQKCSGAVGCALFFCLGGQRFNSGWRWSAVLSFWLAKPKKKEKNICSQKNRTHDIAVIAPALNALATSLAHETHLNCFVLIHFSHSKHVCSLLTNSIHSTKAPHIHSTHSIPLFQLLFTVSMPRAHATAAGTSQRPIEWAFTNDQLAFICPLL